MNTTFLTWLAVAAVVGGALLLFLGMPAGDEAAPLVLETVVTESDDSIDEYWEPVTPIATAPSPVRYVTTRSQPAQPCGTCGATQAAPAAAVRVRQSSVQPCGTCGATHFSPVVPVHVQRPAAASCSQQVSCGTASCLGLPTYCGTPCGYTCPLDKPGINRNMELCLDECTFVQLHTTLSYPICSDVRFEWTTSKGSFLDPTSSDPVYYVPTTHFPDGEDVWVVVTITDGSGARYTDQLKLHVKNLR